jgi:hypothetical protein
MIPNCFENYIGVRADCDATQPLSGLYIDDLYGINLETAASISVAGKTGKQTLYESIKNGIFQTLVDFKAYAQPYYTIKSVLQYTKAGAFSRIFFPPTANTLLRGIVIEQKKYYPCSACSSSLRNNNMQRIIIEKVEILTQNDAPNQELLIEDDGFYYHYPFDAVANEIVEVKTNYVAKTPVVKLWLDNKDLAVSQGVIYNNYSGCASCGNVPEIYVSGHDGIQKVNNLFGINPIVKVSCDEDLLFCAIGDSFKVAFLYAAAVDFAKRWKITQRYNEYTMPENDVDFLYNDYKEKYEREMKNLQMSLHNLLRHFDGNCIYCKGVKYTLSL